MFADVDTREAHARLSELPPPSFTISSGGEGNMHAYWRLQNAVSPAELEAITKPLDAYLSGGEQHVFDASHILRIPGTYSYKYDDKRPIKYLSDDDYVYEPEEIIEPSVEAPKDARPKSDDGLAGVTFEGENRGHKLCQYAGRLHKMGIVGEEALADLRVYNANHCSPPKDDEIVMDIWRRYASSWESSPPESEEESRLIAFTEIIAKEVKWIWRDRLALGKIFSLSGRPKVGKGHFYAHIAAQVTLGDLDGDLEDARDVIVVTTEDDPGEDLKPRLMAAGADLARVHMLQMGSLDRPRRCPTLTRSTQNVSTELADG